MKHFGSNEAVLSETLLINNIDNVAGMLLSNQSIIEDGKLSPPPLLPKDPPGDTGGCAATAVMSELLKHFREEADQKRLRAQWQLVATAVERICFVLFSFVGMSLCALL